MSKSHFPPQYQDHQPGDEHDMRPEPEFIRDDYRGTDKLKGKVALITGGDSGIGRAVAVHYAGKAPIVPWYISMKIVTPRIPRRWSKPKDSAAC